MNHIIRLICKLKGISVNFLGLADNNIVFSGTNQIKRINLLKEIIMKMAFKSPTKICYMTKRAPKTFRRDIVISSCQKN